MIYSNIVPEEKVREVQKETLNIIANALTKSFGPNGSTTAFVKNIDKNGVNIAMEYTKDGHTIVKNISFLHPIERSVQDVLTELTRYVVKEVGDGTTSAIILCKTIFDKLCENDATTKSCSYKILSQFHEAITEVCDRVLAKGRECTLDDIYDIALIATNNNDEIARSIYEIYDQYGMEVYIDTTTSNNIDTFWKGYDGMTLDTGFTDVCFVNNREKNSCAIKNPRIYCFRDPIDTPEMCNMLANIIEHNILSHYRVKNCVEDDIPTVIFAKKLSPDSESFFKTIVELCNRAQGSIPLLMVTDIHQDYIYEDIAQMCGAPWIKKYIDPEQQKEDIEKGLAPTPENIIDWCGTAELVEADQLKTKVVHPARMFDENGDYSEVYKTHLNFLQTQLDKDINENAPIEQIARTRRRLNGFKGNMVDLYIGGITVSDKNNLKASVEDAVLNCRSAAINGVGYGANYMALSTLMEMHDEDKFKNSTSINILLDAYKELTRILYNRQYSDEEIDSMLNDLLENGCPLNIKTNSFDNAVLSSIKSDVVVLEAIDKIITLMFTTNQYLVQTPAHNIYCDGK